MSKWLKSYYKQLNFSHKLIWHSKICCLSTSVKLFVYRCLSNFLFIMIHRIFVYHDQLYIYFGLWISVSEFVFEYSSWNCKNYWSSNIRPYVYEHWVEVIYTVDFLIFVYEHRSSDFKNCWSPNPLLIFELIL